jgi:hypothetical protein
MLPLCTALSCDMTVVCIDILEKFLSESRKANGQPPLTSGIVASGLEAHTKTGRTRKRTVSASMEES